MSTETTQAIEQAKAELAALEALGDGGAARDVEKDGLRRQIARHETPIAPRWGGATQSFADVIERQREKSKAEQLAMAKARLLSLGASEAAGGLEESGEVDDLRRQVSNLTRQIAEAQGVARERAEGAGDQAGLRGRLETGLAETVALARQIEQAVADVETQAGRLLAMGSELERLARQCGLEGKRAEIWNARRLLERYLKWRLGGLMGTSRMDQALRVRLTTSIAELGRMLEGAA